MSIVPKKDHITLLVGDITIFAIALWAALAIRNLVIPSIELITQHLMPFSLLFVVWIFVFFLAGLYGRQTRILRSRLPQTIFYTQSLNMVIAALFFFIVPYFGIAPKTILIIYLLVSSLFIFIWRVYIFSLLRSYRRTHAVLIASGADVDELAEEVNADSRYPFSFETMIDTNSASSHHVVQQICSMTEEENGDAIIVADMKHHAIGSTLPILYDVAFRKNRLVLIDVSQLYQDVFDKVPLSLIHYDWILANLSVSHVYDTVKRGIDIFFAFLGSVITLLFVPIIALAIKLEDGGSIFITQERVGRFQKKIYIVKFRSMSGNDNGKYANGKSSLAVTRVGKVLRRLRIDELPQLWNVLRGDLSFVGPRPELPPLVEQYSSRIPYYDARHLINPGLTGWAQLKHEKDPHHGTDVQETKNKLAYDLFYLKNRSFLLDMYIMFQTVRVVLTRHGS